MTRLRPRSFYDVLAAVALFLLLAGGGAYAAATIGAADIQKDAVRSYHIKDGQVTHADLALNSVGSLKVFDGALSRADLKPGALPLGALSFDRHLDPGTLDSIGPVRGLTLTFLCATPTASDVHVGWRITRMTGTLPSYTKAPWRSTGSSAMPREPPSCTTSNRSAPRPT